MGKKTIKKNYEVEERLLALILMVDNFVFESSASLPEEVRKYTFDYLKKLKEYAGIDKEMVILGTIDKFEIIPAERFDEQYSMDNIDINNALTTLGI